LLAFDPLGAGMDESIFIFISVVLVVIVFFILVFLSTTRRNRVWRALVYAVGLIPAAIQVRNYGFNLEALLGACFFLVLTWVILYCARKQIGKNVEKINVQAGVTCGVSDGNAAGTLESGLSLSYLAFMLFIFRGKAGVRPHQVLVKH
jgi:hypothetical protein